MIGFKKLNEMSDSELREEIVAHYKEHLNTQERSALLMHAMNFRLANYQKRLAEEADIQEDDGPRGFIGIVQ